MKYTQYLLLLTLLTPMHKLNAAAAPAAAAPPALQVEQEPAGWGEWAKQRLLGVQTAAGTQAAAAVRGLREKISTTAADVYSNLGKSWAAYQGNEDTRHLYLSTLYQMVGGDIIANISRSQSAFNSLDTETKERFAEINAALSAARVQAQALNQEGQRIQNELNRKLAIEAPQESATAARLQEQIRTLQTDLQQMQAQRDGFKQLAETLQAEIPAAGAGE